MELRTIFKENEMAIYTWGLNKDLCGQIYWNNFCALDIQIRIIWDKKILEEILPDLFFFNKSYSQDLVFQSMVSNKKGHIFIYDI